MARNTAQDGTSGTGTGGLVRGPDAEWVDEELAVDLEVDEELAFEHDDYPIRLVGEDGDDRFASAYHDDGQYAAEERAMHVIE